MNKEYDSDKISLQALSVKCTARHCKVGLFIRNHCVYKNNMKVITTLISSELAMLCMAVYFQEGMQCKQMCTFPEVFICGNKCYIFSAVTTLILSLALQVKLCFFAIHHYLL